jgi:hypothetical protein
MPTMIITIRKLIGDEGGIGTALERFLARGSSGAAVRGWASSASAARPVLSAQAVPPAPPAPPAPTDRASS